MPETFPKLRTEIDATPANCDGQTYYILFDRSGLSPSRLLVSPVGLLLAGRLDGTLSLLEVSDLLSREVGAGVISSSDIEQIAREFDKALFLHSPRFDDWQAQTLRDFLARPVRAAVAAGQAYAADPDMLAKDLERMLAEAPPLEESPAGVVRGAAAPHLDFGRGAAGYGQLYGVLRRQQAPRTAVILGTAHTPLQGRIALCGKGFETPFGVVEPDWELYGRLREAVSPFMDPAADEPAHRGEHSVELQTIWLRYIYGPELRIVPLLVNSLQPWITGGQEPQTAAADPVLHAASQVLSDAARDGALILASSDLSHAGPRFGGPNELTESVLADLEQADRDYLCAIARGPVQGLQCLAQNGDKWHVCGAAPLFLTGLCLPQSRGCLLGYHQALTNELKQAVTFAAMAFA